MPAAAGAAAGGAAALGALLTMAASGVRPRDVWDGVKDLLTQHQTEETPPDDQAAYDEAEKRFREEGAKNRPRAGARNEKGEVYDAAVGWVKKEDHEILTGQKTHTRSSGRHGSIDDGFDQVAEEKKKLEAVQKNRVDQEKKWNQEDVETIFQREAAATRGVMSKDRLAFLYGLYEKSETLAGMDDQVAAHRELVQLGAIINNQKKPGYRPQYTLRDLAEDYVMRGGATALDFMLTKGYANAAVTAFQTAREDIRFGADNMTALKDGLIAGGIQAATVGVGQAAGKVGISPIGAMAATSGTVHGTLSFRDALAEGKSLAEASVKGVKDGAISGGQAFVMGKLIERAGEIELSSGSKGTGQGFSRGEISGFKTGKGFSETAPEVIKKIESTNKHIITTKGGKKMMDLDEAMKLQQDTRTMRTLKNGKPAEVGEVRVALHNTLKDVKKMHDADVIQKFKADNPRLKTAEMRIEDISTRGKTTEFSTDRDYRLVYKDAKGNWKEVPKEQWQHHSRESFAEVTAYSPDKFRASLSAADKARFDKMTRTDQLDFYQQKSNWKATDKAHIEASRDYSDQHVDLLTGKRRQLSNDEINILKVYDGKAKLIDPESHGQMYHSKVVAEVNAGNKPEAFVQSKKGIEAVEHIRGGYGKQNLKIGQLDPKLQQGMTLVKENAEVIGRGNTAKMAEVEKGLKDLGFKDINDFSDKVSSQIGSLKSA